MIKIMIGIRSKIRKKGIKRMPRRTGARARRKLMLDNYNCLINVDLGNENSPAFNYSAAPVMQQYRDVINHASTFFSFLYSHR